MSESPIPKLPTEANAYYNVEKAQAFLETPVREGYTRWICMLCGCPAGDWPSTFQEVGAFCCGGCGQTCVRPISEWRT